MRKKKRNMKRRITFVLLLLIVVTGISAYHGWNYHKIQYQQYCSEWGIPSQIDEMNWLEPYTAAVIDDQLVTFRMDSNGDVKITKMNEAGQIIGDKSESLIKENAIRAMYYIEPYLIYQTGDQVIAYAYEKNASEAESRHFGDPIFLANEILGFEPCASDPSRFLLYTRNLATLYEVSAKGIMEDRSYISEKDITRAKAERVNGNFALLYYTDRSYALSEGVTKNELVLTDFEGNAPQQLTTVSSVLPVTLVNLNILNNKELNESYVVYEKKRSDRGITSFSLEKITINPTTLAVLHSEEIPTNLLGKTIQAGYWDDTPYILTTSIYHSQFSTMVDSGENGKKSCTVDPNVRKNSEFMNLVTLEGEMRAPQDVHFLVSTYENSVSPMMVSWNGYEYAFFKDVTAGSYWLMITSNHPDYQVFHPLMDQDRIEGIGFGLTAPVQVISNGIIHLLIELLVLFIVLGAAALVSTRRDRAMTKKHFYFYLALYVVINIALVYRFRYMGGPIPNAPGFVNGPGAFIYMPLLINAITYGLLRVLGRTKDYDEMMPIITFILVDVFLINLVYVPFTQILAYLS